jgi:hypothetical protein
VVSNAIVSNGNVSVTGNINATGMIINGNAIITGNANILGTITFNNTSTITTSNLTLALGNTQSGINVNGGGITVGDTDEATWLYDQPNQTWNSNLGISAAANITTSANVVAGVASNIFL